MISKIALIENIPLSRIYTLLTHQECYEIFLVRHLTRSIPAKKQNDAELEIKLA